MKVKFYGTRGTISVGGPNVAKYGGLTTCLRVDSPCLPAGTWLVIDAGTGIVPLTRDGLMAGVKAINLLFTHYHHDHTIGLPISAWVHMKNVLMSMFGPVSRRQGPKEILEGLMCPPNFPVAYEEVASHLRFKGIEHPPGMIIAIHPQGGIKLFKLNDFEAAEKSAPPQLSFGGLSRYSISECMIIRMQKTNHPDYTISYRFEERPTGRVFVFATDHEKEAETPVKLRQHFAGAHVLVADCQYSENLYRERAGYGHGTPEHCVKLAHEAGAEKLGLTHHDPWSTDSYIDQQLQHAKESSQSVGFAGEVFACADFLEIDV